MAVEHPAVIHLVFKTHLDIGFTDLARNVAARYLNDFLPRAMQVALDMRHSGADRFRWTTGAWLIAEALQHASATERARLEQAIADGDLVWHGAPFTTHSELLDADLFAFGLRIAQRLDQRFGTHTIAAKMTDVPGHTRAIVPLLAAAGIQFLHIGVNGASRPPAVPPVFVWRAPDGSDVLVMYQAGGYGDFVAVPGMRHGLVFAHTNDNAGPQTTAHVRAQFAALRQRFPNAQVIGSTMDAFATQMLALKPHVPVVTSEIGDTWIHGVGSDPIKVSAFRELSRLRRHWLGTGQIAPDDARLTALSTNLLLVAEHTWGLDEKSYLPETTTYVPSVLAAHRQRPDVALFESSWNEQRAYVDAAVNALGETALAAQAQAALRAMHPVRPSTTGWLPADANRVLSSGHLSIALDPITGAITRLAERGSGRVWADDTHPLGLLRYQTFDETDYARFYRQYNINKRATTVWSLPDFTKPGIAAAGAQSRWWLPQLTRLVQRRDAAGVHLLAELTMPEGATTQYGCPALFTMQIDLLDAAPELHLTVQWFDKPASRLPEAVWLTFVPLAPAARGWTLHKLGQPIDPLDVVRDGNRHLHAVEAVSYRDTTGAFWLDTPDAPLLAPGDPALLHFNNRQPVLRHGMHINLYNNVWGTNFRMWYDDDTRLRFVLRF